MGEPARDETLIGKTIGAYRIVEKIGEGGMGVVYRAEHPEIGARVAIKVLAAERADRRDAIERFFAEARAVNLIRHEKIVSVIDLGTIEGRPYIIMEHVDGLPLAQVIARRGPLPLRAFVDLVDEVLDALAAAHDAGVIHRDLKPDNVFVTPAGHAVVLDFGIAKLAPELDPRVQTRSGQIVGTPAYMAPEQITNAPLDARADLYAIGVILFEGATGTLPFDGTSDFAILEQQVGKPAPLLRTKRTDAPVALERVVDRALAKDPAARFANAREMQAALRAAIRDLGESEPLMMPSREVPTADRRTRRARPTEERTPRRRWPIVVGALAAVGVASAVAIVATRNREPGNSPRVVAPADAAATVAAPTDAAVTAPADAAMAAPGDASSSGGEVPTGQVTRSGHEALEPWGGITALDSRAYLDHYRAATRKLYPDAELIDYGADHVGRDGRSNLSARGSIVFLAFRVPSRSKPPADLPPGAVRSNRVCQVVHEIDVTKTFHREPNLYPVAMDQTACSRQLLVPPRCTPAQLWKKALAKGAPTDPRAVARIRYFDFAGTNDQRDTPVAGSWVFVVDTFQLRLADDC